MTACACMGPPGDCPCIRRAKGLEINNPWTAEKIAELDAVLKKWNYDQKCTPTECDNCGAGCLGSCSEATD